MIPKECKRLAEVDFPIAVVSRHAAREKSLRHGHPSTLHLWWARRPLASSRVVLLALLLPDPRDSDYPDGFKKVGAEFKGGRSIRKHVRPLEAVTTSNVSPRWTTARRFYNWRKQQAMSENPRYEVALSFAGEQREYVEEVARALQSRSIAVFYDEFEKVTIWGRSLTKELHDVFESSAACAVMFISEAYITKKWPNFERRSILSRMIREGEEYVLPVRFDDSAVPGLPTDTAYLSANTHLPIELAAIIAEKIGIRPFAGKASDVPPPRMSSPNGEAVFDYSDHNGRYVIGRGMHEFETKWTKASDKSIYVYNDPPSINGVALAKSSTSIEQVSNAELLDYTSEIRSPQCGEIVVLRNTGGFYAAVHVLDIKDDSRHDDRDELRFRYAIQTNGTGTFAEFIDGRGL